MSAGRHGLTGQALLDRVETLCALVAAQERDIHHLVDLLAAGRDQDPRCEDLDDGEVS